MNRYMYLLYNLRSKKADSWAKGYGSPVYGVRNQEWQNSECSPIETILNLEIMHAASEGITVPRSPRR